MTGSTPFALMARAFPPNSENPLLADYQRVAVPQLVRMLSRRSGAILADDVGMGKSYVACGVAAAMRTNGAECEFIVPASLVSQWRRVLRIFGLSAPLISHDALLREERVDQGTPARLLVVDEAHRFRNDRTKRYRALALRAIGRKLLLVTATPVCNSERDLLSLLRLFSADDGFREQGVWSLAGTFQRRDWRRVQIVLSEAMVRRTRDVIAEPLLFGGVDRRVIRYSIRDAAMDPALIDRLSFPMIVAPSNRGLLRRILWRRLESSVAALRSTVTRQRRFYRQVLRTGIGGRLLTRRDYLEIFGDREIGQPVQDLLFPELFLPPPEPGSLDLDALRCEIARLDELISRLERTADAKLPKLIPLLEADRCPMLIFTSAVSTAEDLSLRLSEVWRCGLLSSRVSRIGRERVSPGLVLRSFANGHLDVLVATEVGAEGLDLQRAASVVHYDLPWNPVRLDQRNGRASRIGQKREFVRVFYFIPDRRTDETGVASILLAKNRRRRMILGLKEVDGTPTARMQRWIDRALLERSSSVDAADEITIGMAIGSHCLLSHPHASQVGLVVFPEGDRGSTDPVSVVELLDRVGTGETVTALLPGLLKEVEGQWRKQCRGRMLIPPSVGKTRWREMWTSMLARRGELDRQWSEIISSSWPAGVELLLDRLCGGPAAEVDLTSLRALLRDIGLGEQKC